MFVISPRHPNTDFTVETIFFSFFYNTGQQMTLGGDEVATLLFPPTTCKLQDRSVPHFPHLLKQVLIINPNNSFTTILMRKHLKITVLSLALHWGSTQNMVKHSRHGDL